MNWHNQSRSRNEEAPLSVVRWRLVRLGAFAVGCTGAAGSPGTRVFLSCRGRPVVRILQRGLEPRYHFIGVWSPVRLIVLLPGGNLTATVAGPVDSALPPASLVEQFHGPAARRVRVQEEFGILQNRPAGITPDLHDLASRVRTESKDRETELGRASRSTRSTRSARLSLAIFFFSILSSSTAQRSKVERCVATTLASLSSGETRLIAFLQVDTFSTL